VTQEHEYAKPGSLISSATILLRDLFWDAVQINREAFFISLDFQKAFDSIDHCWLYRVLDKMEFPTKIIKIIKAFVVSSLILFRSFQINL